MAPVRFPSLTDDLVLAGEVHYFRLDRADWADRLDDALDLGLTAVATYVPWLVHETADGASTSPAAPGPSSTSARSSACAGSAGSRWSPGPGRS